MLQIFGSIGSVGGGLALGKEGPLVHTGACIASLLGQVSTYYSIYASKLTVVYSESRCMRPYKYLFLNTLFNLNN